METVVFTQWARHPMMTENKDQTERQLANCPQIIDVKRLDKHFLKTVKTLKTWKNRKRFESRVQHPNQ